MALLRKRVAEQECDLGIPGTGCGVLHEHSTGQFVAKDVTARCNLVGLVRSLGVPRSSCDHASAESFRSTFTHKLHRRHSFVNLDALKAGINQFMHRFNHDYRYSKIGKTSSITYGLRFSTEVAAAE